MDEGPPPPPPPPHGENPRPAGGGLPDGNYDIFIIPPHSAGGGFLYLPSLQPHRNSFIAGILVTLAAIGIWIVVAPVLQAWMATVMAGNALGVMILVGVVGLAAWALGKTSGETHAGPGAGGSGGTPGAGQQRYKAGGAQSNGYAPPPGPGSHAPPPPQHEHRQQAPPPPPQEEYRPPPPPPPPPPREDPAPPPPQPEPQSPPPPKPSAAQSGWEKAREETRRKEEERKRAEELQKKREAAQKMREEAERTAKAKAEKEKWEQARAREKEQREREARERILKEKLAKEKEAREKDQREREAREKEEKAKADREAAARERVEKLRIARENIRVASAATAKTTPAPSSAPSPTKRYERPTAKSAVGTEDAHSYRPYDTHSSPAKSRTNYKSSASSISGLSESSYAPSMSTARTTPPPSHRGPYRTDDPNKIVIRAVYEFNDSFPGKPVSQLVSNEGSVTDGLVLRIATEGLFIDDDVRGVPQREWDMKAWQLKSVDDGALKGAGSDGGALHVLRATLRDGVSRKHVFVLEEAEAHKVQLGLQKLKGGPLVRSLKVNSFKESEVKGILSGLGWT